MPENIFYRLDPIWICLALFVLLFLAQDVGFRIRARTKPGSNIVEKADVALIVGSVLTLLALLFGFTYAMSQARFETRRQLVVEEANAIGTTYLRAKTLREPESAEIRELLRQYVALRVEIGQFADETPEKIREWEIRTKELNSLIWSRAAALAKESPNPIVSIFLQSLNEMIDLHGKRLAAFRNRVPLSIYLVLFVVSVTALWLVGYYLGTRKRRARFLSIMLALLVAAVMWLILDLDQPVRGAIRASQQSLLDLYQDLNQESKDTGKKSF